MVGREGRRSVVLAVALLGACDGGNRTAHDPDSDAGDPRPPQIEDAAADRTPGPPAACVTDTYCARDPNVTPCPSGYDCNTNLVPPRCVRLYCAAEGVSCSAAVHCELGLGCGTAGACTRNTVEIFLGTWTWRSGSGVASCGGMPMMTGPPTGSMTFSAGMDAPLVATLDTCMIRFDVAGNVATVRPGQICTAVDGTKLFFDAFTFEVSQSVAQATFRVRVEGIGGGSGISCDVSGSGTLGR